MLDCAYAGNGRRQQDLGQATEENLAEVVELLGDEKEVPKKSQRHHKPGKAKTAGWSGNRTQKSEDGASELEIGHEFDWRRDWWKYLLMALGTLGCVCFTLYLLNKLLRLAAFMCCLCIGGLCSCFASPYILPYVYRLLPASGAGDFLPRAVGYAVTFLVSYFVAMLLMRIIHSPGKVQKQEES